MSDTDSTKKNSTEFAVGDRVQTHPATDAWMSGDRYGEVAKVSLDGSRVYVLMEHSGITRRFLRQDVLPAQQP